MENAVGPVLRMCEEVDLIVAAIEDDNPDTEIDVIDRGAYVRIHAPDHLRVTAESLKRYLGSEFGTRSLEAMMSAFVGRIQTTTEAVEWSLGPAKVSVG